MTRGDLLDVAATVAWRFKAYGSYAGKQATAVRAIRRKCNGFTALQIENAFKKAIELYDCVHQLVRENESSLWASHKAGDKTWPKFLDVTLKQRFPAFKLSTLRMLVGMDFYYWHMR